MAAQYAFREADEKQQHKQEEAVELSAPAGATVYHAINKEGEEELERSTAALGWSGLAAGLSMGFSFVAEAILHHRLPDTPWRPLIAKFGYSIGFLIIVLGRQQLFTENTLTVILPLLRKRDAGMLANVVRLWTVVLAANLAGAALFALALAHTTALPSELHPSLATLGAEAMAQPFATTLVRGIFAGWLIALMGWLLPFAELARVWVIVIITYVVGVAQFSHVVAGSVETMYMVMTAQRSVGAYMGGFLVPSLVGNIVGGVSLVACLAHAQFIASEERA